MTIPSDDLTRFATHFVGFTAIYNGVMGHGILSNGLTLLCCGAALVYTAGVGQDYLRRRDTQVVAYLSSNTGARLPKISAATGLTQERAASSLQRLVADGLVAKESGASRLAHSYRLNR
ncbi:MULTISPECIES: MarR family transcriptional regulator [unclassified Streptomyces]|uniref:MarR family transcriptional regulator n=1 Tax=unclassified Streptomyces TaxID=2593676 RepID=UPI001C2E9E91|nr:MULTISPECIES: MarR family transcriptional regulator [unclassified Streptomyces]MBV1949155.1 MarR family transcriptional regulator [Streptomyces sp. BV129]